MPVINVLEARKYEVHQLGPIFFDEGTLEGTYGVHQDIWLRQLGLDRLEDFRERLWIAGGDQRTTLLNRTIRQDQRFSTQVYDRRDWLVSPSQPFHLSTSSTLSCILIMKMLGIAPPRLLYCTISYSGTDRTSQEKIVHITC
jgi:hypothetical protein